MPFVAPLSPGALSDAVLLPGHPLNPEDLLSPEVAVEAPFTATLDAADATVTLDAADATVTLDVDEFTVELEDLAPLP